VINVAGRYRKVRVYKTVARRQGFSDKSGDHRRNHNFVVQFLLQDYFYYQEVVQ
jgi:hypothetical protein